MGAPPAGGCARATSSIAGLRSVPTTEPVGPTIGAARRATTPVPQARSSTRWPGRGAIHRRNTRAKGPKTLGTW
jgi:hypothetical protein